jgi:hypothetical protein
MHQSEPAVLEPPNEGGGRLFSSVQVIGAEERTITPGDVAVIPGGVEHEAFFPEDTEVIDFFAPVREDFLTGEIPAYMAQR